MCICVWGTECLLLLIDSYYYWFTFFLLILRMMCVYIRTCAMHSGIEKEREREKEPDQQSMWWSGKTLESEGRTEAPLDRVDSFSLLFIFTVGGLPVGLPSNACHAICLTVHFFSCFCTLSFQKTFYFVYYDYSLFDVEPCTTFTNHLCLFFHVWCLLFPPYRMCHWDCPASESFCANIRRFQRTFEIARKWANVIPSDRLLPVVRAL